MNECKICHEEKQDIELVWGVCFSCVSGGATVDEVYSAIYNRGVSK